LNEISTFNWVLLAIVGIWFIVLVISLVTLWNRRDIILPKRIFWMAVILFAPVVGLILYLFVGAKKRPATAIEQRRPS